MMAILSQEELMRCGRKLVSADVDYQAEAGDKDIKHMPLMGCIGLRPTPTCPANGLYLDR